MNFQVKPDTVASYGSLIERNGIDLSLVNVQLAQYANLGSTEGLWIQTLIGAHDATVSGISDSLYRGFHAMGDSGVELKRTVDYYLRTDERSAAKLDGGYPGSPRPAIEPPDSYRPPHLDGKAGPFAGGPGTDVQDPLGFLNQPAQLAEFTDPMKFFNVVNDFLSPTWWLNQVLNDTIGVNPLEKVTDLIAGDWEGFARCGLVWEDLSKATGAIGENVDHGLTWLAADWQGNAADAAVHYFDYVRQALASHRDVLHRLHDKYLETALGLWNGARSLADILKALLDQAILAGVAVLAGSLVSWTGVGAGISWGFAAYECYRIVELWGDATKLISSMQAAIEGFVGFLQSQEAHVLAEIQPIPMPATDYDHPGVVPERVGPRVKGLTL